MGIVNFAGALAAGAAALACWIDVRLARRRPESYTVRIGHALAAYCAVRVTAAVAHGIAGSENSAELLAVLLLVVLPSLVYAFLTGLWLMRTLVEVARLARR
jgi:Kef-type K+ transport system membrane component KefB